MSGYFRTMGTVWYLLDSGENVLMTDISKFTTFLQSWRDNPDCYLQYQIKEEERVDQISYHAYGTVNYWWTILLLNNIYDMEEQWPRSYEQLSDYIANKYPFNSMDDILYYVNPEGLIVDLLALRLDTGIESDADIIFKMELHPVTIFDYEHQINENKRYIKLIDPDLISKVITDYESIMS